MFRKVSILTAVVLVLSACQLQAAVIDSNWVGGEWGFWEENTNWSSTQYPDNDFDTYNVTIDGNTNGAIIKLQDFHTIDTLKTYGRVELDQWQSEWIELTVLNGITNFGTATIRCQIRGDVNNTTGATLDFDKHMNIFGQLYNPFGGTIQLEFEDVDIEDSNIVNCGLIVAYNDGSLGEANHFLNSGRIELFGGFCHGGIFDNNEIGIIEGFGGISSDQLIENKGSIYASAGSMLLFSGGSITNTGILGNKPSASLYIKPAEDVNNNGKIEVNHGGVTFDCNLVNEPNGVISLLGGALAATTITQKPEATFEGFGGITGNVVIDPGATIKLKGSTDIVGNVTVEGTLEISDGVTLITGQTVCNGTIHIKGGYLIPQGGLSGDCNIIWEPGLFTNPADFNLDGEVNFGDFAYFAETWLWQTSWQ